MQHSLCAALVICLVNPAKYFLSHTHTSSKSLREVGYLPCSPMPKMQVVPKIQAMPPPMGDAQPPVMPSRPSQEEQGAKHLASEPKQKTSQAGSSVKGWVTFASQSIREATHAGVAAATSSYQTLRRDGARACAAEVTTSAKGVVKTVLGQAKVTFADGKAKANSGISSFLAEANVAYERAIASAGKQLKVGRSRAGEMADKAKAAAKDGKVQATAAGAASGAALLGAGGASAGLVAGTTAGAGLGLIPALFTFGLSVPAGAFLGGGAGLLFGMAMGSTAGALGGAAAGNKVYAKRDEIREGAQSTLSKVSSGTDLIKGKAVATAGFVRESVRARLPFGAARAA